MTKLCQITALLTGKKTQAEREITEVYHLFQKPQLCAGLTRTYTPKDDDGEILPAERQNVSLHVEDMFNKVREILTPMWDLVATQDEANRHASADVKVDGVAILKEIPVTHLLFLEKQLVNLKTLISAVPTLDPSEVWDYDANTRSFTAEPTTTHRTKKVMKAFVKYHATEQHPAQVDTFTEDVVVGYWRTRKFSGATPAEKKEAMLTRIGKLQEAVKMAREEANAIDAAKQNVGNSLFGYIFDGV